MQELQATLPVGTVVGNRYNVENLLGKGGFGAVYLVRDQRVKGNLFALKEVIDTDKKERARFAFECDVLRRLDHPALPRVYRAIEDDVRNRAYMLMDYIEGPNLETLRLRQPDRRFALPQVLDMMRPIFDAVTYLHNQTPPIIHRDIKPANIIIPTADDNAVLVDFGIAKEYDPDSTTTAVRRCSPGYGAPEQYSMGTNTRTDIYGLGATIYALLTGHIPDDAFYRMTQMSSNGIDPLKPVKQLVPSIPLAVSQAIERAMAINSDERFASVQEFWQALNAYQPDRATPVPLAPVAPVTPFPLANGGTPVNPTPWLGVSPDTEDTVTRSRKRRLLPFILLAIALLLFAATATAFGFLLSSANNHHTGLTPGLAATQTAQARPTVRPTTKPTAKPTAKPTTAPTATATTPPPAPTRAPTTPPAPVYPAVAGTHSGTVRNSNNGVRSGLTVSLQQSQSAISGSVTIAPPLTGSGPITSGFVNTSNYIQFVVQGYQGNAPLLFTGYVASDGSMSGGYCSLNSSGQCSASAGGQGTWSLGSAPSGGS